MGKKITRKSKFIGERVEEVKAKTKISVANSQIIKKGDQTFKKCNKCGWVHPAVETSCRFCGNKI